MYYLKEARRRRQEMTVELRKASKDNQLLKRRNINIDINEPTSPIQEKSTEKFPSIDNIIIGMTTNDEGIQLQAIQACRKILSRERNPPIDLMIEKGIVPLCIQFLKADYKYVIIFFQCHSY